MACTELEKLEVAKISHSQKLAAQIEQLHELYHTNEPETLDELSAKMFPQEGLASRIEQIHVLYHNGQNEAATKKINLLKGVDFDPQDPVAIPKNWDALKTAMWLNRTHGNPPANPAGPLTQNIEVVIIN